MAEVPLADIGALRAAIDDLQIIIDQRDAAEAEVVDDSAIAPSYVHDQWEEQSRPIVETEPPEPDDGFAVADTPEEPF